MLNQEQIGWLRPVIVTLQITCAGMILGALAAGLVLITVNTNRQFNNSLDVLSMLGIVMALGCFAASVIVPRITQKAAARQLSKSVKAEGDNLTRETLRKFAEPLQTSSIMRYALIEGPTFANLLFWFVEGSLFSLAFAGAGLAMMVLFFPFPNRVIQTVETMIDDAKHA